MKKILLSFFIIPLFFTASAIDVSFERTYYNAIVLTNVTIDGVEKQLKFIFDTASSSSFLSQDALALLTNPKVKQQELKVSDGYDEQIFNEFIKVGVAIDGVYFSKKKFTINDDFLSTLSCDIDGLIGYDIIKDMVWQLGKERIQIHRSIAEINAAQLALFYQQKIKLFYHVPSVVLSFGTYYSASFLFDMGYNSTLSISNQASFGVPLSDRFVSMGATLYKGIGIQSAAAFGLIGDYDDSLRLLKMPNIQFGDLPTIKRETIDKKLYNCLTDVEMDDQALLPNAIGAGILNYYEVILDPKKKQIYTKLKDNNHNIENSTSFGVTIIPIQAGEYRAGAVWQKSTAIKQIYPNDTILKINKLDLTDKSIPICEQYKKVVQLLENSTNLQFTIKNAEGSIQQMELKKEVLFD